MAIGSIKLIKLFIAIFFIVFGAILIIASFLMPSTEVEISLPLPFSIFAEVKNGRIVIRGTDTDAWLVELSLGIALILVGIVTLFTLITTRI